MLQWRLSTSMIDFQSLRPYLTLVLFRSRSMKLRRRRYWQSEAGPTKEVNQVSHCNGRLGRSWEGVKGQETGCGERSPALFPPLPRRYWM